MALSPAPRNLYHKNRSDPSRRWGDKFENHVTACHRDFTQNCLIGDSHFERLLRPHFNSIFQNQNYLNLAIGGDRCENILWRIKHGSIPKSPNNIILSAGTNNLSGTSKNSIEIAETILEIVRFILNNYPKSNLVVVGVLPIKEQSKCHQPQSINSYLKYKLQEGVHFAQPPKIFQGELGEQFYQDNVHLNLRGYRELFKVINPFLKPDITIHPN
jgi:beta-glucosidase